MKKQRGRNPCELKMGVANSIPTIRIKHSFTLELQENLANRIGFTLRIKNAVVCDLRFGALSS